jgi:CheY-like chemotaxis protein
MHEIDTPLRLLAVEDDPTDRSWLELMLKDATVCPYVMRFVGTMADALSALHAGDYDCVLLDLSLPDSDGIESVRRVLDTRASMPIVVFTGRKDQEVGLRAIEEGAQDYLVKGQASGNTILQAARWASVRVRSRTDDGKADDLGDRLVEAWVKIGLDLKVTDASPSFLQMIGANDTEVLGLPVTSFLDADNAGRTAEVVRRLADGEGSSLVAPIDLTHRLGHTVGRTLVATPLRSVTPGESAVDGLFVLFAAPAPPPAPPPPAPPPPDS